MALVIFSISFSSITTASAVGRVMGVPASSPSNIAFSSSGSSSSLSSGLIGNRSESTNFKLPDTGTGGSKGCAAVLIVGDADALRDLNNGPAGNSIVSSSNVNLGNMLEVSGGGGDTSVPPGRAVSVSGIGGSVITNGYSELSLPFAGDTVSSLKTLQGLPGAALSLLLSSPVVFGLSGVVVRSSYWVLCGAALLPSMPLVAAQTNQEIGVCGIVAATDIASKSGYNEWSCTSGGIPLTDPCTGPWTGVTCASGVVDNVNLNMKGLSGR